LFDIVISIVATKLNFKDRKVNYSFILMKN